MMTARGRLLMLLAVVVAALVSACAGGAGDDGAAVSDTAAAAADEGEEGEDSPTADGQDADDAPGPEDGDGDAGYVLGLANQSLAVAHPAAIGRGAREHGEEIGVEVIELDGDNDAQKQLNDVQDLIARGVDGIMLIPVDSSAAVGMVEAANEAGVPIMAVGTPVGGTDRAVEDVYPGLVALVTQDEVEAGRRAGRILVDAFPDGATIAVVEGAAGFAQTILRQQGFEEVLGEAGGDYEIVARQPGDWVPDVAYDACENMLVANPDIEAIFLHSDGMTRGCAEAAEALGIALPDDLALIGIGGDEFAIDLLERGLALGSVCFKPQTLGATAVDAFVAHLDGETTLDGDWITYDTPPVTADDYAACDPPQW